MSAITKNIPNLFTIGNLLCGCIGAVYAFQGDLIMTAYLMFVAAVLDFLDGFVARALNAQSPIGAQLDSFADMITFGFLPGLIVYKLTESAWMATGEVGPSEFLLYPAFIITAFAAIRLAIFNLDTSGTSDFKGMATPACAIFMAGLAFIIEDNSFGLKSIVEMPVVMYIIIGLFSYLMVSPVAMFSLKFKSYGWKGNEFQYILLISALCLILALQLTSVSFIILVYLILSLIYNFTRKNEIPG